jgi:hypothetical protein
MALPLGDNRIENRETIDAADLRAAKRRRQSRVIVDELPAADADAADVADDRGRPGQKLTKGQRTILIRLIAAHHYVDAVRAALAEDYPEFPRVSDQLIRYYRQQIDADVLEEAKIARDQVLRAGLANKAVRVRSLIRMAEQWRRVPLVESSRFFDEAGQEQTAYKTREGASRELREVLKQIALELGQLAPALPASAAGAVFGDADEEADEDEIRATVNELLAEALERDRATDAALAAAVRPAE